MSEPLIPPHGGYRDLLSYQRAEMVYDLTVEFCTRFLERRDRTVDQMVQAARSGKQNIVEGSMASGTSRETEIKLTGVARASLEELLIDAGDFLRTRGLPSWEKDHPEVRRLSVLLRTPGCSVETIRAAFDLHDPAVAANVIAGLVHVTGYLLDRQLRALEERFVREGGLRERMTQARLAHRQKERR